jgi:peptide/nickel transport system substrate-binding protein
MRKATLFVTLLAALCLLVMAVGPASAQSALKVAIDSPPRTMNPHGSDADSNLSVMANFFDGLLQLKDGEFKPALAVRYEHPDLLTWKFYLREGVTFHNGNAFDAEDVKFSFERLNDPEVSEFTNTGKSIASVEVVDPHTVVVKTTEPIQWFANNLHQIFMMDKESTESRDPGKVGLEPIGTGAYKLTEWVKGSYFKIAANEDYWEGAPSIKTVEVSPVSESSTRFAALVSGQADIVTGVPVELYDKVEQNPKLEVINRPARRAIFLSLTNKEGTPMADTRVRKAMYMAINEDEIVEKIMRGHATPTAQVPDKATIGYNPDLERYPYDPDKAKALLKEAGYADGFDITLAAPNDRYVQDEQIAEAVAKYLAKVGIRCKPDVKPKSVFFPEVQEAKHQFYLIGWLDGAFDMGRTYFNLIHTYEPEKGYGTWNGARFSDPEVDKMLQSTTDIVDRDEREKVLQELNKLTMIDKIGWIPLHYQQDIYAIQKGKGIQFTPRADRWMVYKEIAIQ